MQLKRMNDRVLSRAIKLGLSIRLCKVNKVERPLLRRKLESASNFGPVRS